MKLVIVESPNKVKKIKGFLGDGYRVQASVGHIRDLPKEGGLNVAFTNGQVVPNYEIIDGKGQVVKDLSAAAKAADEVLLATDPDREGEAIAWHLTQALGKKHRYQRVTFNSITEDAVRAAIASPRAIDMGLVNAQQARRVLDRLVGWVVSPTCKIGVGDKNAKSAGRVQSVALRIVAEREQEISTFVPREFFVIRAELECPTKPPKFVAKLATLDGQEIGQALTDPGMVGAWMGELNKATWSVIKVTSQNARRLPPAPFVTSTIQQAASVKLKWRPDKTMKVLQSCFEGGHITYHRTDSTALSPEGVSMAREWIAANYPPEYLPDKPVSHASKVANAQEAHEAIRPTHPESGPDALGDDDNGQLYRLIWQRYIACQMAIGLDEVTVIDVAGGPRAVFRAKGVVTKFLGWRKVTSDATDDPDAKDSADDDSSQLPPVVQGDDLRLLRTDPGKTTTKPPPRFTEASLIKALEGHGIGRPSTYAAIMAKLLDANYLLEKARKLHCTELGLRLTDFLKDAYRDNFIEIDYTRKLEGLLDAVARGEQPWEPIVSEAAHALVGRAQSAGLQTNPLSGEPESTVECPLCGKPMSQRNGPRGPFWGCTKYPKCKGIRPIEDAPPQDPPQPAT